MTYKPTRVIAFSKLEIEDQEYYIEPRIEVKNYRYAWNGLTRSRQSYTEYEFWLDDVLTHTVKSGYRFNRASQFAKSLEKKYELDKGEIRIEKREVINLQFLP